MNKKPTLRLLTFTLILVWVFSTIILMAVLTAMDSHSMAWGFVLVGNFMVVLISIPGTFAQHAKVVWDSPLYSALTYFIIPFIAVIFLCFAGGVAFMAPFLLCSAYAYLHLRKGPVFRSIKIPVFKVHVATLLIFFVVITIFAIYRYQINTADNACDYYQGYVFDEHETPISGVRVRALNRWDPDKYQETATDTAGYFRIYRGDVYFDNLTFTKPGYQTDTMRTFGFHPELGTEYYFLRHPGSVMMQKDTTIIMEQTQ